MTDRPPPRDDEYARGSFTWRRMQPWQYWTMAIVVILLVLLVIFLWPTYETEMPAGDLETAPEEGAVAPDAGTPPAAEAVPGGGEPAPPDAR